MQTVRGLAITQLWRHPGKQACDLRCGGQNLCQSQPTIHIPMEPVTRTTKNKTLACPWLVIAEKNTNQHQLVCSQYLRDGEANRKNKKKKHPTFFGVSLEKWRPLQLKLTYLPGTQRIGSLTTLLLGRNQEHLSPGLGPGGKSSGYGAGTNPPPHLTSFQATQPRSWCQCRFR
jgi:hypothetical protein